MMSRIPHRRIIKDVMRCGGYTTPALLSINQPIMQDDMTSEHTTSERSSSVAARTGSGSIYWNPEKQEPGREEQHQCILLVLNGVTPDGESMR